MLNILCTKQPIQVRVKGQRMPSIELGDVFTGSGEGAIILIGGGTVLDFEGKFCPTALRLSTGIKAI
ncbi:hypothetical protein E2C01_035115 [Portunus trituberculatus]|uniref:Uncharacterized protein n=1 Tax=Portunus trituberculatus TaxID=210409 RepID=A0A5B7F8H0_PORTR|nr:hypothetical protein [Portunus trituberculatus]